MQRAARANVRVFVVLAVAMSAPLAIAGIAEDIRYYELYVGPHFDGQNNVASSWAGVYQPAVVHGDGYGNDDRDSATMGLKHNGTARFVDSGAGLDGFWMRMPVNNVVDMEVMAHSNCAPAGTGGTTYTGHSLEVLANDDYGLCIALDTDKIRLVNKTTGTYAQAAIDLTTWKKLRLAISNLTPTSGEDLPPLGGGTAATSYVKIYTEVGGAWVSLIDWSQVQSDSVVPLDNTIRNDGNNAPKFVIHCSDSYTTNSDFSAQYFRVTGGTYNFIAQGGGGGGAATMRTPQENAVYDDACGLMVTPIGTYSASVAYGVGKTAYYLVADTRNTTGQTSHWTVTEVTSGGAPTDYDWVSASPTNGDLTSNQTQNDPAAGTVSQYTTVTLNGAGTLGDGAHTAYLKFADDDCPANALIRQINLTVDACTWSVSPTSRIESTPEVPYATSRNHVFTITNTGGAGYNTLNYTAEECDGAKQVHDMVWMSLDKTGGTLAPGQNDTVTMTIDFTKLSTGDNEGHVKFTNNCNPSDVVYVKVLPPFIVQYQGDVLPTAPNAAGDNMTWVAWNTAGSPAVAVEGSAQGVYGAVDDKCLKIADDGASKMEYRSDRTVNIDGDGTYGVGATLVARLKCTYEISTSHNNFSIRDNSGLSCAFHWGGAGGPGGSPTPGHVKEGYRATTGINELWIPGQTAEWYADWHTIRLTAEGNSGTTTRIIRLYFDEDPNPIIEINDAEAKSETANNDALGFGASSTAGQAVVYYDWITGTNAGAFPPGEEEALLGRSLCLGPNCYTSPCNGALFADTDKDGDVDQQDFAAFQVCFTGEGGGIPDDPDYCRCLDRRNNDNTPGKDHDIDGFDLEAFEDCAGGPGVPADPACED